MYGHFKTDSNQTEDESEYKTMIKEHSAIRKELANELLTYVKRVANNDFQNESQYESIAPVAQVIELLTR